MMKHFLDRMKLPFQKERELRLSLYKILGFYPQRISLYKQALMHKSVMRRNDNGRPMNNERLEFLGDAILSAIVGDIVYEHFPGKREGFLTNTRSKLVQREMLNRLAQDMGINQLVYSEGNIFSHNNYMGGNAFEALVGAIYIDRGYDACMRFMKKRILANLVNIDIVAEKEVNFKSRLLEWCQKHKFEIEYRMLDMKMDKDGNPTFDFVVVVEGIECGTGTGYSKKESQQKASRVTIDRLKRDRRFVERVKAKKEERLQKLLQPTTTEIPEVKETKPVQAPQSVQETVDIPAIQEVKEETPKPKRRRAPRKKKETATVVETVETPTVQETPVVAEPTAEPAKPKRRRAPRKKKETTAVVETVDTQTVQEPPVVAEPTAEPAKPKRRRAPRKKKETTNKTQ